VCPGWSSAALETWRRDDVRAVALIAATCIPTGVLPVLAGAAARPDSTHGRLYSRHREMAVAAANAAQFWQVALFYGRLYYAEPGCEPSAARTAAALLFANGVAFLALTSLCGVLLFRWQLFAQYAYLLILLAHNQDLSRASPALRKALWWATRRAADAVGAAAPHAAAPLRAAGALRSCVVAQAALLTLGFGVMLFVVYAREQVARRAFLRGRGIEPCGEHPSRSDAFLYVLLPIALAALAHASDTWAGALT
jgi:hypothetical protein